jgi:hypothetical protein
MSNNQPIPFVCLPYLPLMSSHRISQWLILPVGQYTGPWISEIYKKRAEQLLKHFVWANGMAAKDIPIVVSAENGASGIVPDESDGRALQLAIDFASIDQSMVLPGDPLPRLLTTDNTELQKWPLSDDGYIAYPTGLMVRTTHGGWNLDQNDWKVPCPLDVYMPNVKVSLHDELATAIYETIQKGYADPANTTERRFTITLGWWAKSWRNSSSVSWEDRIVLLKTGFEALLDESSTPKASKLLRQLFESAAKHAGEEVKGLLWTQAEIPSRDHPFTTPTYQGTKVTDLEHWFLSFGSARNDIIHQGAAATLSYSEADSAYNGSFVMVGERVLREALKMQLELLGYGGLWKTGLDRAIHTAHAEFPEEVSG